MAFLKKLQNYIPEALVIIFLITILWVLFLPHFESPFRIKLNIEQAKQIFLFSAFASMCLFLGNYFLPKLFFDFRYKIGGIVLLNFVFATIYFLIILSILELPFDRISHRFGVVSQPLWSLFLCGFSSVLGFLVYFYKSSLLEKEHLQIREKELQELNLSSLKNQLNPHFLFNVLNNIDAEIMTNPAFASDLLIRLSKLMRYVIYEDKEVLLSKEIKFVEEYTELQTARNQAKITCHFEKEINNENVWIAPAIFLPYIENAFKYCDLTKEINIVSIVLKQEGNLIFFSVQNPIFQEVSSYKKGGKGLEIAKGRLQMYYPNCFSVSIHKQENLFSVEIKVWIK